MINTTELITTQKGELQQVELCDMYTNTLTPLTKMNYISTIKEFFGVSDLNQITIEQMQAVTPNMANIYAHKLLAEGNAKSTINRKLSALANLYDFLCRIDIRVTTFNPFSPKQGCIRFKNTTKDYSDKKTLTPEEVSKMFKLAAKEGDIMGTRDLLVLQLLVTTGMRRAELCSIKIGDINETGGRHIVSITGKGNKTRIIVIADHIYLLIKKYMHMRKITFKDKNLPLIISHSSNADPTKHIDTTTVYRIVKKYAEKAGLDASLISPHNMRHTFATTSYAELGYTKDELQSLLGHSSSATTQRYIKQVDMIKNSPADKLAELYKI